MSDPRHDDRTDIQDDLSRISEGDAVQVITEEGYCVEGTAEAPVFHHSNHGEFTGQAEASGTYRIPLVVDQAATPDGAVLVDVELSATYHCGDWAAPVLTGRAQAVAHREAGAIARDAGYRSLGTVETIQVGAATDQLRRPTVLVRIPALALADAPDARPLATVERAVSEALAEMSLESPGSITTTVETPATSSGLAFAPDVERDGQQGDCWVDADGEEYFVPLSTGGEDA